MHISRHTRLWLGLLIIGITAAYLLTVAYQHRGFFAYHYALLASPRVAAVQDELVALVQTDPTRAFAAFRAHLAEEPLSYNSCHGVAHQMGHEAYEALGFAGAMAVQDGLCGGGYIHGVIEGRFGLLQERDILAVLPELCEKDALSCYHGVGHGLMIATRLNQRTSLAYCDRLPGLGARNCYDGVWMHIFDLEESGARVVGTPQEVDPAQVQEQAALCAKADTPYKASCYFYLPRVYAHQNELAFTSYAALCQTVEADFQIACAAGTGHARMKYHMSDPVTALSDCEGYTSSTMRAGCREGGMLYYLFSTESSATGPIDLGKVCEQLTRAEDRAVCQQVRGYRDRL